MLKIKESKITKVEASGITDYVWQCPECNLVKHEQDNPHIGDKVKCRNKKCNTEFEVIKST